MNRRISLTPGESLAIYEKLDAIERELKKDQQILDPILSTEQVLKLLNISRRLLQKWRDEETIEFSAINGKFFYRMSAINKMLDQNLQKMEEPIIEKFKTQGGNQ